MSRLEALSQRFRLAEDHGESCDDLAARVARWFPLGVEPLGRPTEGRLSLAPSPPTIRGCGRLPRRRHPAAGGRPAAWFASTVADYMAAVTRGHPGMSAVALSLSRVRYFASLYTADPCAVPHLPVRPASTCRRYAAGTRRRNTDTFCLTCCGRLCLGLHVHTRRLDRCSSAAAVVRRTSHSSPAYGGLYRSTPTVALTAAAATVCPVPAFFDPFDAP